MARGVKLVVNCVRRLLELKANFLLLRAKMEEQFGYFSNGADNGQTWIEALTPTTARPLPQKLEALHWSADPLIVTLSAV